MGLALHIITNFKIIFLSNKGGFTCVTNVLNFIAWLINNCNFNLLAYNIPLNFINITDFIENACNLLKNKKLPIIIRKILKITGIYFIYKEITCFTLKYKEFLMFISNLLKFKGNPLIYRKFHTKQGFALSSIKFH